MDMFQRTMPGADQLPGRFDPGFEDPRMQEAILTQKLGQAITKDTIHEATERLRQYKESLEPLYQRLIEEELWWELREWEAMGKAMDLQPGQMPATTSAWLFNFINAKHADLMDNIPGFLVRAREQSDEETAKILNEIIPCILENAGWDDIYDRIAQDFLLHGTAAFMAHWDTDAENGIGDVGISALDLIRMAWEPGVEDIQKSRDVFIWELCDPDELKERYPQLREQNLSMGGIDIKEYQYGHKVDNTQKACVIDWYYKVNIGGRDVLHYCKFCGDTILESTENDPQTYPNGLYDHGKFPVIMSPMYRIKGSPAGFGLVRVLMQPQMYVDKLSDNILQASLIGSKTRIMASDAAQVNVEEFLDLNVDVIRVAGEIDERRVRQLTMEPPSALYLNVLNQKIEEMKETTANRDISNGGTGGTDTAAGIAALQESGNKQSRDIVRRIWRTIPELVGMVVELLRQFYTEARVFRITAPNDMAMLMQQLQAMGLMGGAGMQPGPGTNPDGTRYVSFSNQGLQDQPVGIGSDGQALFRRPIFDYKIKAEKQSPFSRAEQNATAKELYGMGFFNPQNAPQSLIALSMMEFEGKDQIVEQVQQGLMGLLQQMLMGAAASGGAGVAGPDRSTGDNRLTDEVMQATSGSTSYGERLKANARAGVGG